MLSPPLSRSLYSCPRLVPVWLHVALLPLSFTSPAFMCSPAPRALPSSCNLSCWFQKLASPADEKWNGVSWIEPISSSLVKISRGSLERMLCVKEPAKWRNTVGGFIIIFLLLCMYNDCPHYQTQDDVHNYITPDATEPGASIVHYSWCLFDNTFVWLVCLFEVSDRLANVVFLQITLHTLRWRFSYWRGQRTIYNVFEHYRQNERNFLPRDRAKLFRSFPHIIWIMCNFEKQWDLVVNKIWGLMEGRASVIACRH